MAEVTVQKPNRLRRFLTNPVTQKELRSRMRGKRAFVILSLYLLLMSALIMLIYGTYIYNVPAYTSDARIGGKIVFGAVVAVQVFLAAFIGPAFTSGTISGEKERQTYDLLRTTLLPARALVSGKLLSALSYVGLLLLASLPLHGIAFMLGGLSFTEFAVSQLMILTAAVAFALWGLYISTMMRSTLSATVVTYAGTLFMLIGIPFVSLFASGFGGSGLFFEFWGSTTVKTYQVVLAYVSYFLATTNLPMAMGFAEAMYLDNGAIWSRTETVTGVGKLWIWSPWWMFVVLYALFALFVYWRCVRRVRRVALK